MKDFRGMKRQRNRNNRKPSGNQNNPNRAYESNGPEGTKVRGNAQTIYEKYQQLARDANSSGDRVLAENHLQHAEHYFRMIRQMQPQRPVSEFVQRDPFSNGFDDFDDELENGAETEVEADAQASQGDDQPSENGRYERNDRNRDRQNNGGQTYNGQTYNGQNNRDRDRNNNRDFRQNNNPNNNQANAQNGDAEGDENGGRRETRRERYERRRQQRFAEQQDAYQAAPSGNVPAPNGYVASTEPLGAPRPAPQPEVIAEAPASAPRERTPRAPRESKPVETADHLPAFLSRPAPVAAPEAAVEEPAAKPKRGRKPKQDAAVEEA